MVPCFYQNNPEESTGTIAYAYELGNLNFVLERSVEPFQGAAYVLDQEGLILYDSRVQRQGQVFPDFGSLTQAAEQLHHRGDKLYALVYLETEKLWAMAEMDAFLLYDQVFQYALLIVVVILALGLLSVASTRQAVRGLSRRVNALQDVMLVAQTGDLTIRADGRPNDEIGSLARSCNDMIEKIQEFIEEKYLSEIRQQQTDIRLREAALRALQSQVDPHFLYNTLETIRMQAIVNEDHETAMLIEMLAKLFRARLQEGHITTLSGEVAMLRSLIEIMGARFDGELALQITLPQALEDAAILKDLIQPIVENAFVHGLYLCPKDMPKRLIIHAREEEGKLIIEVANSHVHQAVDLTPAIELGGLSPEGRKRVGLRNVHERIAMVYGPGYGVSFRNTSQDLLSVYITLKMADYGQLNAMARGEENHVPRTPGGR